MSVPYYDVRGLKELMEENARAYNERLVELNKEHDEVRRDRDRCQALARAIGEYLK